MSVQTDINKLVKEMKRQGWTEEYGSKHRKIFHPKGGFVSMSVSPSCQHAKKNIESDIRRLKKSHGEEVK